MRCPSRLQLAQRVVGMVSATEGFRFAMMHKAGLGWGRGQRSVADYHSKAWETNSANICKNCFQHWLPECWAKSLQSWFVSTNSQVQETSSVLWHVDAVASVLRAKLFKRLSALFLSGSTMFPAEQVLWPFGNWRGVNHERCNFMLRTRTKPKTKPSQLAGYGGTKSTAPACKSVPHTHASDWTMRCTKCWSVWDCHRKRPICCRHSCNTPTSGFRGKHLQQMRYISN